MAIQFPTSRKQVESRTRADVKSQLPNSNPWLKNSFLGALITGISGRVYESYLQMKNVLLEMYPDTADGIYLERWGSYVGINRNPSTQSSGPVLFSGTAGTLIPSGALLSSTNAQIYVTTEAGTIADQLLSISSLTQSGGTALAICTTAHGLATGTTVTVSGAVQSGYNISAQISVESTTSFSYSVDAATISPATGTIIATFTGVALNVQAQGFGSLTNQLSGAPLTVTSAIPGSNSTVYVMPDELGGGTDEESDTNYRSRVLYRYQNPVAMFNVSSITNEAFKQPGVTRVWVKEAGTATSPQSVVSITRSGSIATVTTTASHNLEDGQYATISGASPAGYNLTGKILYLSDTTFAYAVDSSLSTPATGTILCTPSIPNGQVKIYFMRDDDAGDPIPSGSEVTDVNALIQAIRPAHVASTDVIVNAPTAVPVNFDFNGTLLPNTAEMQAAITISLTRLFAAEVNVSETLQSAAYISSIWQTIDATGARVASFTLTAPSGSVAITEGQLPTLGTISF